MPWIQINLLEGRSMEKMQRLHELVTAAAAEALEIPKDAIKIQLIEIPVGHYSHGGVPSDQKKA